MEVDGRQLCVEVAQAKQHRHAQIEERPGKGVADGPAGLAGLLGPLGRCEPAVASALESPKPAGVKSPEMKLERHENMLLSSFSQKK